MPHNDFHLEEFKLKDPIRGVQDGLKEPIQDKTPGFFQSLRNPIDLIREESLPASLYQWITGNTKKKQAQEALDYIRNNPDQAGSKIFKEAERKLNRFGYLLEEGPMNIDIKEVGNMIKQNPKVFGAELINMIVADPYLLFLPLGWGRLGRAVVNSIRMKTGKRLQYKKLAKQTASDYKVGAFATLATPIVFSTTWQLGEKAELDPKRTTVETTIGATAGALFSVGFAGAGAVAQRLRLPKVKIDRAAQEVLDKYKINPDELVNYTKEGNYKFIDELINRLAKEAEDINPRKFEVMKADITVALRTIMENAKDASMAASLKKAAAVGGVFGTAQFLTADDDKLLATAKGFGAGVAIYGAGKLLTNSFRKATKELDEAALSGEAAMDTMKMITVKLNSTAAELANVIKNSIPDAVDSRRKIFYYLTEATVDRKTFRYNPKLKPIASSELSKEELAAANAIRKVFDQYHEIFEKQGLLNSKRSNYLPLIWANYNPAKQPFAFMKDHGDITITGPSAKFRFAKKGTFGDINRGLQKRLEIKPGMDDPVNLIPIYTNAASKALATRALIRNLEVTQIENKPLLIRNFIKKTFDDSNYTEFKHPYFADKGDTVLVHKGMINSLRMVFDATDEPQLMGALFTTNLMMKRLAVGFSFFHAGALVESMWFAGTKWNTFKQVLDPRKKPEILKMVEDPKTSLKDHRHAIFQLQQHGFEDAVRFAQGAGLKISVPEDVGFDRFYYNIRGFDKYLKRIFGIKDTGTEAPKIEKVFRWFDTITWDRVFTAAKMHTFLTVLDKPTLLGVPNKMRIVSGDTQADIYRKATQAATFSNDAFGGQNWEQIANRVGNESFKRLAQTILAPGSRGYMQLLLFAPDWTISNIRIIAKSLPLFESDPALRRMYQYYFARAALTYATAGSALNYIFSGHSLLDNKDPTRIDLGDGQVLTFSKQLMEPFHWITDPQSTGLKKIGSLPRTVIEVLTNKQYLTTKWSPNLTKKDDEAIEKGLKIGGHVGMRFLPIWLQSASRNIAEGLQQEGLSLDLASDTAVDFVLGQLGHPRYQGPRYTQYKTRGLVRDPYKTLF